MRLATFAACTALLAACQPKDSSAKKEAETPQEQGAATPTAATTATGTTTAADTGTVTLAPTELVTTVGAAMTSAAEVKSDGGVSLNPGTIALATSLTDPQPCRNSGSPNVADTNAMSGGEYAGLAAYCDLAMHPDGPDTTLGGIDRVQSFLCATEGQYQWDGKPTDVLMKIDDKCFNPAFIKMANEQGFLEFTVTVTAKDGVDEAFGSTKYTKSLTMVAETGFNYEILLDQKDGVLAAAVHSDDDEDSDVFAFTLDTNAPATVRYEGRFTKVSGTKEPKARHLRVVAKGTYDKDKKAFTALDDLNYVYWDRYFDGGYGGGDSVRTVKGSPGKGYKGTQAGRSGDDATITHLVPSGNGIACWAGDCAGNDGITVKAEDDLAFIKSIVPEETAAYVEAKAWFKKHGPLAYDAVALTGEQD